MLQEAGRSKDYAESPLTNLPILNNIHEAETLAERYRIPVEDVIMIGLNLSGISAEISDDRIRFTLQLKPSEEQFYMALCVNTAPTQFAYRNSQIFLGGTAIGNVINPEEDTCNDNYFRRNKTELTLNTNSRSSCQGCNICKTYHLNADDKVRLLDDSTLSGRLAAILHENGLPDASSLHRVTICTGCFGTEERALSHILMVNRALKNSGFDGILRFMGSEVVSEGALDAISRKVDRFALSLTVEVFTRRRELLIPVKSRLSMDQVKAALNGLNQRGFEGNILYVLGLDPKHAVIDGFQELAPNMNHFPVINLFQMYGSEQMALRDSEASKMEYYLDVRQELERIFNSTSLRPESWENYRPLWYTAFAGEPKNDIRI
jgi:hypothetical protein